MKGVYQELPPKGGYEPLQWKRNLPARGFRPSIYFLGVAGLCSYGFYVLISGLREKNELTREKQWSRIFLQPLLEAEADRDAYRRIKSLRAKEQEIMSNVPDFDAEKSVYHDPKFRKPSVTGFPKF